MVTPVVTGPLYKTLVDGRSHVASSMVWSLPVRDEDGQWQPGAWHQHEGPVKACQSGLHLTSDPVKWLGKNSETYLAEGGGVCDASQAGDRLAPKVAFQRARLLRPAPEVMPAWWQSHLAFVREEIPATPWFTPDGDPDPTWKLFTGQRLGQRQGQRLGQRPVHVCGAHLRWTAVG